MAHTGAAHTPARSRTTFLRWRHATLHAGEVQADKLSENALASSKSVLVVRAAKTASRTDVQLFGSQEDRCRDDVKWTWRRPSVHANVQGRDEREGIVQKQGTHQTFLC